MDGYKRHIAALALVLFAWFMVAPGYLSSQEQDPLTAARQAMGVGLLDEAAAILEGFIRGHRDQTGERSRLAEAHYLLARIHFDQKNGEKSDACLREVLRLDPDYDCLESNLDFRDRFEQLKREIAEKESVLESQAGKKKKRSALRPFILAAGILAVIGSIIVLFSSKKDKEKNELSLEVDAKKNCIDLNRVTTEIPTIEVSPGEYAIDVFGAAYYFLYNPFNGVFVRYPNGVDSHKIDFWQLGSRRVAISGSGTLYAFFTDWFDTYANSGSLTIDIGGQRLALNAQVNCIFLNYSNAARVFLQTGVYRLAISGSALDSGIPFSKVLVRYVGSDGLAYSDALAIGDSIGRELNVRDGLFYAFFVGYEKVDGNSGGVTITFSRSE